MWGTDNSMLNFICCLSLECFTWVQFVKCFYPSDIPGSEVYCHCLWCLSVHDCLDHCLETMHGNCFIFSGPITLTWDLCIFGSFWPSTLILWHSSRRFSPGQGLWTIICTCFIFSRQIHLTCTVGLLWPFDSSIILSWRIKLTWNLHTMWAGTFWPLTLKLWPSPWKSCPGHYCIIFSGHMMLTWNLCILESFWPFDLQFW